MPSYEQIELVGGPCNGETHSWDGGDYFVTHRQATPTKVYQDFHGHKAAWGEVQRLTYVRSRDAEGNRTSRFVYQEGHR